jgi:transcriptional regulator PpsR
VNEPRHRLRQKTEQALKTDGSTLLKGGSMPLIAPDLLAEIISTAADLALLVSPDDRILSVLVNHHHRSFGQVRNWEGRPIRDVLTPESSHKLDDRLTAVRNGEGLRSVAVELTHLEGSAWEFPVRYTLHRLGPDGSVLMLGRDLRPIAEMQQRLVAAQIALERDYETQREMETRYRVVLEATRDALMLISMANGRIVDLNNSAALKLGAGRSDLVGAAVAQEFEGTRRGEFLERLTTLAAADAATPVDLVARRSKRRVVLVPTVFRAAGEKLMLCRIDDPAEAEVVPDELASNLGRLFHGGVDAIVFADEDGLIRHANEAFLNLVDAAGIASVRGRSLADFLARGVVDLKVLMENARRVGQMRLYATKLVTDFDGQVSVEISVSLLNERVPPGIALLIRDVSRADTVRRAGVANGEEGMRNIMELVGSSPLRDIVAQTADVVEKMCIETAVELTRNNRVAAAEMLGLSRQSLYVKLRKYGLIAKDAPE